jgi:tetratricopeptide (TPR) repeat protein
MRFFIFTIEMKKIIIKAVAVCLLVLTADVAPSLAQFRGAPVKKERLVQALRSRQLQTDDIVTIINRNGVDFRLTAETKKLLIAAGARPQVIEAISNNSRFAAPDTSATVAKTVRRNVKIKPAAPDYDDLLEQAIYSYKDQKNPKSAVQILKAAARVKPENPAAYQMLGFVYLYGLKDLAQAEKSMRESFTNGGSAVFRVFHDDNGKFTHRCTGSLYISQNTLRFESDDNVHTFETSTVNIEKLKLDTETTREWKKRSIFKVILKFGKEEAKFRFAPLTGVQEESRMVERFVAASNSNIIPAGSAVSVSSIR